MNESLSYPHILCSTRQLAPAGFTKKTRELDDKKTGEIDRWRKRFAELQNERFQENGIAAAVDHRSLEAQGIDREPTRHLGPAATGYERRTGKPSTKRLDFERETAERLARAKELGELEREAQALECSIIDLSGNLSAAKAERASQQQPEVDLVLTQKPIKAVLRQKDKQPLQSPVLNPVKLAEQLKSGFFEAAKAAWKEGEVKRHTQKAADSTQHYWQLRDVEPKEPLLFGKREWQFKHDAWVDQVNDLRQAVKNSEKQAKATQDGKFDKDQNNVWAWNKQAQERFEKERPELAQALQEYRLAEQQKAKEEGMIDKTLAAFKAHASRRDGKFWGYGDDGKQWNALPEGLRTMIEGFNQLPKEARPIALEGMRESWTRKPEAAEKITQQLEQAEEQNRDRGMSR
jgi:hypothetical protein